MKRVFIAIDIPLDQEIVEKINTLKSELKKEKIKWVKSQQYHITIQFLGNVENSDIKHISDSLDKIAGKLMKFSVELSEFGVFKSLKNPRILWIGFSPCEKLVKLKNAVEDEMTEFGFEKSDKSFSPHLTIARIKMIRHTERLKELIGMYKGKILQVVNVDEIIFYESILKQEGPEYKIIKRHILRQD